MEGDTVLTSTGSIANCLAKFAVLFVTIGVGIVIGFQYSGDTLSLKGFYITALLQALNTFYDYLYFVVCYQKSMSKVLKVLMSAIILFQVFLFFISLCCVCGVFTDFAYAVISVLLVLTPITLLFYDFFVHLDNNDESRENRDKQ